MLLNVVINAQLSVQTAFKRERVYSKCFLTHGRAPEASLGMGSGETLVHFCIPVSPLLRRLRGLGFSRAPKSFTTPLPSNLTMADPNILSKPIRGISLQKAF